MESRGSVHGGTKLTEPTGNSWLDRKAALTDTQAFAVLDVTAIQGLLSVDPYDFAEAELRKYVSDLRAELQTVAYWARVARKQWPTLIKPEESRADIREDIDSSPVPQVRAESSESSVGQLPLFGVQSSDENW